MAGRGAQTFKKRQKEQQRKEKQQEKMAKRLQRKHEKAAGGDPDSDLLLIGVDGEPSTTESDIQPEGAPQNPGFHTAGH